MADESADVDVPLAAYPGFHTTDVDTAEDAAARLFSPHRLSAADLSAFDAHARAVRLARVSLYYVKYGSSVLLDAPPFADYVAVTLPLTGWMYIEHRGEKFVAAAGQGAAVLSAYDPVHMRWSSDFSMLCLRVELSALTESLGQLNPGSEAGRLTFAPQVLARHAADALYGVARMAQAVFEGAGLIDRIPQTLTRRVEDQVVTTLLIAQPHSHSASIFRPAGAAGQLVRGAVELIESDSAPLLSVREVARHLGVSVRTLELSFRRDLDRSPRDFMQDFRVARAHDDLTRGGRQVTVTQIAAKWGFAHTGRFAAYYRTRYGCWPSQTLRGS